MQGIYKVTCKINNKIYVGQSVNIEIRLKGHTKNHLNENLVDYNTKFYRALRKHGIENFTFEIIEEVKTKSLMNDRETYWISRYDSFKNGYNSTSGGNNVTDSGELHPNAKNSNNEILKLKNDLLNTTISQRDLGVKYGITQSTVSLINLGKLWNTLGNYTYPIRKKEARLNGQNHSRTVLNDKIVMNMRKRYENEMAKNIYEDYKDLCSYATFERALMGRTYKYLPVYKKKDKKWINN